MDKEAIIKAWQQEEARAIWEKFKEFEEELNKFSIKYDELDTNKAFEGFWDVLGDEGFEFGAALEEAFDIKIFEED